MSTFKFIVVCWVPMCGMLALSKGIHPAIAIPATLIAFLAALHWAGIKPTRP